MVRVYGAQLSDLSDRAARLMGVAHGHSIDTGSAVALASGDARGLQTKNMPWWVRQRMARILELDDFEGTLRWTQSLGTLAKTSAQAEVFEGNSSLKLTTGAVAGNQAGGYIGLPAVVGEAGMWLVIGMRWRFSVLANTTPRYFEVHWINDDENYTFTHRWRYKQYVSAVPQQRYEYWTSAGAWAVPPTMILPTDWTAKGWQYTELTLRFDSLTWQWYYGRLTHNEYTYDWPSTLGQRSATGVTAYGRLYIQAETDVAMATDVLVDGLYVATLHQQP